MARRLPPIDFFLILCTMVAVTPAQEQSSSELVRELDLAGEWRFEIGDNPQYASRKFDDSRWERIRVPGTWENDGFPGYDGYAWYRKKITIDERLRGKKLYLKLGRIDDVDRAFFNGVAVGGMGEFPPSFSTAWNVRRLYPIPEDCIRFGKENTIAIRVYDISQGGGIYQGRIGIYTKPKELTLAVDMHGKWRFRTGDDPSWSSPRFNDSAWIDMPVPSIWEAQGVADYDGVAWYRKEIVIPRKLASAKLILLAGKIDDRDEVYWNGTLIGRTGSICDHTPRNCPDCYKVVRTYFIPPQCIKPGAKNLVAVRVCDHGGGGGIYEGPVGVITREEYLRSK
jgi:hypothetical protein